MISLLTLLASLTLFVLPLQFEAMPGPYCKSCTDGVKRRIRTVGRRCSNCVELSGIPNPPFRSEEEKAIHKEKRRAALVARDLAVNHNDETVFGIPSPADVEAAFAESRDTFLAKLNVVKSEYPAVEIMNSIVIHGEGSEYNFNNECCRGSLVGGPSKDGVPRRNKIVMTDTFNGVECWRQLNAAERREIGTDEGSLIFLSVNKRLAHDVEEYLHNLVLSLGKTDDKISLLQTVSGNGGCRAPGPYRVGVRFIVRKVDGSFSIPGAILGSAIPEGMKNIGELKPSAARKRKVSDES
jgi:hypothetical protein